MMPFKISSVQGGAGAYCAFNGLLMLVIPHQYLSPSYAALHPQLWLWGLLFLLAGSFMLGVALLHMPRRATIIAHVLTGASLLLLAAGFVSSQIWSGTINLSVLGLGTLFAALPIGAAMRDRHRSAGDLLSLLAGLGMIGNGLLMLLAPTQYGAPLYAPIRPFLTWFGLAFAIGGTLLVYLQLRPARQKATAFRWIAHLVGGAILFSFLPLVIVGQIWSGIPFYGVIAVLVALTPWQDRIGWGIDGGALRTRMALAMALVAAVPLILMTAWFSGRAEQETRLTALAGKQTLATALASSVQNYAREHRNAVLTLAANPDLMVMTPYEQQFLLQISARAYPDIVAFSTYDSDGKPLVRSDYLPPTAFLPTLLSSIKAANGPIDMVIISPALHRPVFIFAAPVNRLDNSLSGIVVVSVESARISELLEKSDSSAGGIVYLVDSTGRVIAHPDEALVAGFTNLSDKEPVAAFLERPDGSGALNYGTPAKEHLAGYARVPGMGWGVIVEQPVATALAASRTAREQLLILVLVFLVAAALTGVLVARGMATPLSDLVAATTAIAENEQSVLLPTSGIRELDRLADAFGTMRERVTARTTELTTTNNSLINEIAARAQVEQALRATEQRLFQILEAIPIGVFVTDSTGKAYFANQSAEKMLGKGIDPHARPEDLAETYSAYIANTPELYPVERMPLVRALTGEHSMVDNMEIERPDGRLLMEVRGAPVYDAEGKIEYAVTAFSDITLRKRNEAMLRELASIVESSSDAIMSCSLDGIIMAWNRGAELMYSHSRLEAVGKSISLVVPPDLMGEMTGLLNRINNGEDFENIETERIKKDGTRFPVEVTLSSIKAVDGTVVGYAGIARDITSRKKAEEALRESEQRYTSVIATLEEGIAIQRVDGSILAINESTDTILGIPMGQMLGLRSLYSHLRAIREDGTPLTTEDDPTAITLRTGLPCSHVIVGIHRPGDDHLSWLSVNSQPLIRPGETQPYAVVSSLTDITERKQAEEALHEMATRDALTGLFNRREMMRILDEETGRFRRYRHPVSLVMLDVDHFKQVNDTYGHQVGDEVLQWVAKHFQESLRDTDYPARYGGEEFAAILPDTAAVGAMQIAERLRRRVAAKPFTTMRPDGSYIEIPVTVSVGVADIVETAGGGAADEAVIAKADQALYQAKRAGRNCTVLFNQTTLATVPLTPHEIVVDPLISGQLVNRLTDIDTKAFAAHRTSNLP